MNYTDMDSTDAWQRINRALLRRTHKPRARPKAGPGSVITPEQSAEAIRRAKAGEPVADIAKDMKLPYKNLYGHISKAMPKPPTKRVQITHETAMQIKRMLDAGETKLAVANKFGCSVSTIKLIKRGKHPALTNPNHKPRAALSQSDIEKILDRHKRGESGAAIARSIGLGSETVRYHIRTIKEAS